MKIAILILVSAFLASCQKSENSTNNNGAPNTGGQEQGQSAKKTLKFSEILEQNLSAKETINWGSSESFPFKEDDSERVKFSYFFQENKLVKSKDLEKSKGYCEFSTTAQANANGSEINLTAESALMRFMDFRSEKTEINNLNYRYDAMFRLTFQTVREAAATSSRQYELACYNVLDLAQLKSTVDSKFIFKKREDKETK